MFDTEVKHLYDELQRKLKTNSETSLTNVNQEIQSTRNNIISRINDMISNYGIQIDSNLIESIVDETLIEDLKNSSRNILSQSYRTLSQFNDSIQAVMIDQAKKQIAKETKQEQIKIVMDKFDYTMQAYKENKINMLEQYNRLFQTILRKAPLYTSPELVDDIKNFLTREKDAMESYIQTQRNNIITSNLNGLVDSNTYLTEQTDFISTAITQTTEEIETQVRVAEEKVEDEIKQSYEQAQKVEKEIRNETQIQQQVVQPTIQPEQPKEEIPQQVQQVQQPTFQEKLDEYKTLYAPSFTSSEQELNTEQPQQVQNQNYRILDDGTIEWLTPRNIAPLSEEEQQVLSSMDKAPSKVDQEVMLINIVKENINQNLWNEIGIIASNTDNTIDVLSGQISHEIQSVLQRNGINSNGILNQRIITELNTELKEINNNLSENMIKSFTKINNDTMDAIQRTFARPEEIRNQDVDQSLEVYRENTSLASFSLTCQKQFEQCMNKICYQYNVPTNSSIYNDLMRTLESKRMQMETQFYNMYMTFSHSNSMFIDKAVGSTMLSQDMMKEMQQDLTPQQIQTMIGYNYQEYEKNYFDMKAQQDLEQVSGMRM